MTASLTTGQASAGVRTPLPCASFAAFRRAFPYQGRALYEMLFDRHEAQIRTKKAKFAVSNLEKIFTATFKLSTQIGFQAMSLRQLASETGISMGGLYSCLASKEDIAVMVKDLVQTISGELIDTVESVEDPRRALETSLRHQVFATHLLQPWFSFLYFETRSLPRPQQEDSKNIELAVTRHLAGLIRRGQAQGMFREDVPAVVASALVAFIQDGYLKPWKWRALGMDADAYADAAGDLAQRLLPAPPAAPA